MYEDGFDIIMDDSDPSNFVASIEKQEVGNYNETYGNVSVEGSGTSSVCENTITIPITHSLPIYAWSPERCFNK